MCTSNSKLDRHWKDYITGETFPDCRSQQTKTWRGSVKWLPQYCQERQFSDNCCHFYMAGWSFPDYKSHLNISRTPYFCLKFGKKFIDKSHLSISCTLDCYFLARRNVLGCIHVMRRLAKERQDAIDVVQKTLHASLIAWAKVCGDAVI